MTCSLKLDEPTWTSFSKNNCKSRAERLGERLKGAAGIEEDQNGTPPLEDWGEDAAAAPSSLQQSLVEYQRASCGAIMLHTED